jgi:hypothetical protein
MGNWESSAKPCRVTAIALHPYSHNIVFAAADEPEVYLPTTATNSGIWYSSDYGESWQRCQTLGLGNTHMGALLVDPMDPSTLLVGTVTTGLWKGTIIGMECDQLVVEAIDPDESLPDCLSNPRLQVKPAGRSLARWSLVVDVFPQQAGRSFYLTVYDIGGRTLARLNDGPLNVGRHQFVWPGQSDLLPPQGAYVCRLEAPGLAETRRIVVCR